MTWVEQCSPSLSSPSSLSSRYHSLLSLPDSLNALVPSIIKTNRPAPRPSLDTTTKPTSSYLHSPASSSASPYPASTSYYHSSAATLMPPPPVPRKRKQADRDRSASPVPESSASPSSHGGDSEYDPVGTNAGSRAPRPKRIQSKPPAPATLDLAPANMRVGPNGRPMSREQLRKANHSLIERRRREKINFALSELRGMVPGLGEDGAKGGEFKLEVLERTVEHMRDLKQQVAELQDRIENMQRASESEDMDVDSEPTMSRSSIDYHGSSNDYHGSSNDYHGHSTRNSHPVPRHSQPSRPPTRPHSLSHSHHSATHSHQSYSHSHSPGGHKISSQTPPSPSMTPPLRHSRGMSPDPNETEPEPDLPPPLTLAHRATGGGSDNTDSSGHTVSPRPHPPSIASLIATTNQLKRESASGNSRNGQPSPNLYLPFPTPSPTSPFLTYHGSAASTASSVTGPPEPSPFMAPLQNISLFGGALDTPNTIDGDRNDRKQPSPPHLAMPPPGHPRAGDLGAEEAANLLLAISSPETLRPNKTGSTPIMSALSMPPSQRRNLDSEDFCLDGGKATKATYHHSHQSGNKVPKQGKTARDILRM